MIRIRPEQIATFQAQYSAELLDRVVHHIRTEHSDVVEGFPESLVRKMVQNGLIRARRYRLTGEADLTTFVSLMFMIAPNFDEQPAIHRVLTRADLPPDERFGRVGRVRDRHWRDAQHRYDERAWFPELYDNDPDGGTPSIRIRRVQR